MATDLVGYCDPDGVFQWVEIEIEEEELDEVD